MKAWRIALAVLVSLAASGMAAFACNLTDGLIGGSVPCDADLSTSPLHCGACAKACAYGANSVPTCNDGGCALTCAAGFADCDTDASDGCETDLTKDSLNCGRCAHDCIGGACLSGACQPVTLLSGASAPAHIVMDSTSIYGVNGDGTVIRIDKDGGDPTTLVSGTSRALQYPYPRLAMDDTSIYWSVFQVAQSVVDGGGDGGGDGGVHDAGPKDAAADGPSDAATEASPPGALLRIAQDGGAPEALEVTSTPPYAVYVGGETLYWSEGNPYLNEPATVKECALGDAGPCVGRVVTPLPVGKVWDLGADATYLYVSNAAVPPATVGVIGKCVLGQTNGCMNLVDNLSSAFGITTDTANVYFSTSTGNIEECVSIGCSDKPAALATYEDGPRFLASDGARVYFATTDGAIKSVPVGGGPEQVLFQLRGSSPWSVAVDATAVYWTDTASTASLGIPGPALRRIAK